MCACSEQLADKDLGCDGDCSQSTLEKCEGACVATEGCAVVVWHIPDKHCHTLTGTVTHDAFVAGLRPQLSANSCMLVKAQ